jgi:tRNA(Met) cytidine acetyltransferase
VVENLLKDLLDSSHSDSCSVLLANRGRGKSAAVGLTLSNLFFKKKFRSLNVTISSPYLLNVQTLFDFISRGLSSRKIKFSTIYKNRGISEIRISKKIRFQYLQPSEINRDLKSSIIIIDEAASIPVEILREVLRVKSKKIFISTIHGYEGASRGFQYKIINYLRNQQQILLKEYTLTQPIRFLKNDSIEELLNKSFLLNVETNPIFSEDINRDLITLQKYSDPSYLFSEEGSSELRQLFGIMIYAHYRNQPNDLLLVADSDNHFLIGFYGVNNQNKKILLGSSQLAREGKISKHDLDRIISGDFIEGDIIPSIAIRHFSYDLANFQGLRIVRIASHQNLIGKGYGRLALEKIIEEFPSYDWIGVSFGATVKLMKFWKKFGFKIVHIRPTKTAETGEWNVIVIRAKNPSVINIVDQASADFLIQFITLLKHSLHSMKPELVVQILRSCSLTPNHRPKITTSGRIRLRNYLKRNVNFLLAIDVIYELVVAYFITPSTIELSPSQEMLLISRVLQGRTWGQTLGRTGLNWKSAHGLIEKAVDKLANVFL